MRIPAAYPLVPLLLGIWVAHAQSAPLVVTDAWMRATPGTQVAAIYMTVRNPQPRAVNLIGASSPAAESAMIHESSLTGTQASMRPREQLRLAAGETLHFSPGGLHVMLMN